LVSMINAGIGGAIGVNNNMMMSTAGSVGTRSIFQPPPTTITTNTQEHHHYSPLAYAQQSQQQHHILNENAALYSLHPDGYATYTTTLDDPVDEQYFPTHTITAIIIIQC
jgi:hypothetical protein